MDQVKSRIADIAVLVVDDYREFTRLITDILKPLGVRKIDCASDGSAALKKLQENDYGLVICDWNMAPMSGYELLRVVRSDLHLRKIPFFMLSGSAQSADHILAAKAAGVTHFIAKPFRPATLLARLKDVFGDIDP
jgi:two-component system chemotaxis response regulator CheY